MHLSRYYQSILYPDKHIHRMVSTNSMPFFMCTRSRSSLFKFEAVHLWGLFLLFTRDRLHFETVCNRVYTGTCGRSVFKFYVRSASHFNCYKARFQAETQTRTPVASYPSRSQTEGIMGRPDEKCTFARRCSSRKITTGYESGRNREKCETGLRVKTGACMDFAWLAPKWDLLINRSQTWTLWWPQMRTK